MVAIVVLVFVVASAIGTEVHITDIDDVYYDSREVDGYFGMIKHGFTVITYIGSLSALCVSIIGIFGVFITAVANIFGYGNEVYALLVGWLG